METDENAAAVAATVNRRKRDTTMREACIVQCAQRFHDRPQQMMHLIDRHHIAHHRTMDSTESSRICGYPKIDSHTVGGGAGIEDGTDPLSDR